MSLPAAEFMCAGRSCAWLFQTLIIGKISISQSYHWYRAHWSQQTICNCFDCQSITWHSFLLQYISFIPILLNPIIRLILYQIKTPNHFLYIPLSLYLIIEYKNVPISLNPISFCARSAYFSCFWLSKAICQT
jgi:hypothetical protein